jgi:hypothetical protein
MNIFSIPYHRWVLDAAKLRFGQKNIKSRRKAEDIPLLGAYRITLRDEKKYLGYFHYRKETVEFEEVKEE